VKVTKVSATIPTIVWIVSDDNFSPLERTLLMKFALQLGATVISDSWGAAVGKVTPHVFEDNRKAWSGDHCVDPVLVPGVLFSNRKLDVNNPGIEDMAPTALDLFGIERPSWMEGKSLVYSS